jgi:hypothetical protein
MSFVNVTFKNIVTYKCGKQENICHKYLLNIQIFFSEYMLNYFKLF